MKTEVFCFTDAGAALAKRLREILALPQSCVRSTQRIAEKYGFLSFHSITEDAGTLFDTRDALIFIGACGIAVRAVAPWIRDKATDPAVLVLDDRGSYVIPLLSGHIGGANALARRIAALIGAQAVITTATDTAGRFSCDAWAAKNGFAISSMTLAKEVSAAILTADVPITAEYPLPEVLPDGLIRQNSGELGIYIGTRIAAPFSRTLRLIPRMLNVGVGCRRGTKKEAILDAVRTVFDQNALDVRAIRQIVSIDIKKDEEGLRGAAESLGVQTAFYPAGELNAVKGSFSGSDFVRDTVGTDCVCERAAVRAGGRLIVGKTVLDGVTVAVAQEERRLQF